MKADSIFVTIIHGYFPFFCQFSLSENYHLHACIAAHKAGYSNIVALVHSGADIMRTDPHMVTLREMYGISITIIPFDYTYQLLYHIIRFAWTSYTRDILIYFNSHEISTYLAAITARIASSGRIKSIFMAHTQPKRSTTLRQHIQDILFLCFDRIRLNNETERQYLLHRGISIRKLYVCPLVVDETIFTSITPTTQRHELLYIGQLSQKKDVPTILRALRTIVDSDKRYAHIVLNVVGPENGYQIADDIHVLKLAANVHLWGLMPQSVELNDVMNRCAISLNSSKDEGQCLTVFESALAGCALCVPRIMSFVDIFKGKALFHEVGDSDTLARNCIYYLEHPDVRARHIRNCRDMIQSSYTNERIESALITLYTFTSR